MSTTLTCGIDLPPAYVHYFKANAAAAILAAYFRKKQQDSGDSPFCLTLNAISLETGLNTKTIQRIKRGFVLAGFLSETHVKKEGIIYQFHTQELERSIQG